MAPTIYTRLIRVMKDVGAIEKGQENKFDHYKFRGIDDVYAALQPALVEHGVVVAPEVLSIETGDYTTAKGAVMRSAVLTVKYHFFGEDGETFSVTVVGEGADRGDKAINKAHSSAFKNAMFQTLCIPTEEKSDSEHESPEGPKARKPRKKGAAKKADDPRDMTGNSPAKFLFGYMQNAVTAKGADPDIYAAGALNAILTQLGIDKTHGADLKARKDAILDAIDEWTPPAGDIDYVSDHVEEMRGLHAWAMSECGLGSEKAHTALHEAAEGLGADGLGALPMSSIAALREAVRATHGPREGTV